MSESQESISARLRIQLAAEEDFRFQSLYRSLVALHQPIAISGALSTISEEDARKVIEWLNVVPGDNRTLRNAIAALYPGIDVEQIHLLMTRGGESLCHKAGRAEADIDLVTCKICRTEHERLTESTIS